jgi:hypothetical protein
MVVSVGPFVWNCKLTINGQIQMTDSDVETGLDAYIGNRRLRMDLELATATRGRVQLVVYNSLLIIVIILVNNW